MLFEKPVLARFPKSHRARAGAEQFLGYEPHYWRSFESEGSFVFLPPPDAKKLFESKHATKPSRKYHSVTLHSCWNQPDPFRGLPPIDERCPHAPEHRTLAPGGYFASKSYCCACGRYFDL